MGICEGKELGSEVTGCVEGVCVGSLELGVDVNGPTVGLAEGNEVVGAIEGCEECGWKLGALDGIPLGSKEGLHLKTFLLS